MRKATASTVINCNVETFWKLFLDEDYIKKLFLEGLEFKKIEVLEMTDTVRKLRGVPKLNMPKPVMKVLGDSFGYEEHATLDRDKNIWRWTMVPNTMADRLKTSGVITIEPMGDDKVRRVNEASMEAKVFGVGGLIESSTEKEIRTGWDKDTVFMNAWLSRS